VESLFENDLLELVGHVEARLLGFLRVEHHEGAAKLLSNLLVHWVFGLAKHLVEPGFIFFQVALGRKNLKTNDLVADSHLKLLPDLFAVNNLAQRVSFELEQILNEPIIDLLLDLSNRGGFVFRRESIATLVELDVLSELFEELQNVISSFVLDCAQEHRAQESVINLHISRLMDQNDKAFRVFLETLAALQKEHKVFECGYRDRVVVLQEILHVLAEHNGYFLLNADKHNQINDRLVNLATFMLNHVLDNLLEMLFLGMKSHRLKQTAVHCSA
jgi:hypothetical protein